MNSKERILDAIRGGEVDYVPLVIPWNEDQKKHEMLPWNNQRERLAYSAQKGWDTCLSIGAQARPSSEVTVAKSILEENGAKILSQTWTTPAATLRETIKLTDDWDRRELERPYLWLLSDFRTARYIEYPFKNEQDLEALRYIFPMESKTDADYMAKSYAEQRALADEFGYPLFLYLDAGMDWLMWLYPPEEQVYRAMDQPEYIERLLDHINSVKLKRLEIALALGIDGVIRRGWYESTDIWSPELLRRFALPALEKEIDIVHEAGKVYIYTIVTGIKGIATDLSRLNFDCIHGPDPVLGDMSVKEVHEAFRGKTLWGGLSAPGHFGATFSELAAKAVEDAISICGKTRLILGMAASYRHYFPWENYVAAEKAWLKFR